MTNRHDAHFGDPADRVAQEEIERRTRNNVTDRA